ncbi:hypothetical protein PIIN_04562 [Serendipita indica DSM 11827]|uniref:Uncharacterized protein n=1 Tax=Serendipita indica (strain DSM 11827) TaxID=1109443 RepID=G4TH32_SERID|nr:hypothetical protein PIIN_04562 [Serendipita indica DSM 11827]
MLRAKVVALSHVLELVVIDECLRFVTLSKGCDGELAYYTTDMNDLGEWWPLDTMNINSDATAPVESTRNEDQGSTHVIEHAPLVDASAWSTFDYGSVPAYPARGLRSDLQAQSTSSYGINTFDYAQVLVPLPALTTAYPNAPAPSNTPFPSLLPQPQPAHCKRPLCSYCGRTHTRPVRDRACRNKHLGLLPFVCGGDCGKLEWSVLLLSGYSGRLTSVAKHRVSLKIFASAERKAAHVRGRVNCEVWYVCRVP